MEVTARLNSSGRASLCGHLGEGLKEESAVWASREGRSRQREQPVRGGEAERTCFA